MSVDTNGIPNSKNSIALDFWIKMNYVQRAEIMGKVKKAKTLSIYQQRCLDYIIANMITFNLNGNILTGKLNG